MQMWLTVGHVVPDATEHGESVACTTAPAHQTNEHPAVVVAHHQRATGVALINTRETRVSRYQQYSIVYFQNNLSKIIFTVRVSQDLS